MAKPINCEDNSHEEDWAYCGKRECVSCGVGEEKKKSDDQAFRTGWSLLKRRPQPKPYKMFCGVCNTVTVWESEDESINQTGEWGDHRCTGCGISGDQHAAYHRYHLAGGI